MFTHDAVVAAQPTLSSVSRAVEGHAQTTQPPRQKSFESTTHLPRHRATVITQLRAKLTLADASPLKPAMSCQCGNRFISSPHILLDCDKEPARSEQVIRLVNLDGPVTWDSITNTNIPVKPLLRFMVTTGLLRVRHSITNDKDAQNAG